MTKFGENLIFKDFFGENEKANSILINNLIYHKVIKKTFTEGNYKDDFCKFMQSEIVFTYKGYKSLIEKMIKTNKSFREEINEILYQNNILISKNVIHFIEIGFLILIGFIINDFFRYIGFSNDIFYEKKHSLFFLTSFVYFFITLFSISRIDLSILKRFNENNNDEYN